MSQTLGDATAFGAITSEWKAKDVLQRQRRRRRGVGACPITCYTFDRSVESAVQLSCDRATRLHFFKPLSRWWQLQVRVEPMRSFAIDWVGVALVAVGGTLAAGLFLVIALTNPSTLQVVGLAAAFAVAVIGAACIFTNFFSVVLFFIFCRITLDGLKTGGSAGASFLDPATLVGAAFILASVLWLLGQALSGQYRPASTVTKLFYGLVAWSFASALVSELPMEALTASAKLLAGVLMLGVLEQLLPGRPDRVKQLLASVLGSAVIPMAVGCYQALTGSGDTSSTPGFNRVLGTAVTPVAFASYLIIIAIVVAGLLGGQRRYRLPLSLFGMVTLLLIYWTFTRSAWLVTAVGIVSSSPA